MTVKSTLGASRLEAFFQALHDRYAGTDTDWWFGARHIFRHDNWNRIVLWPQGGTVLSPTSGAQGFVTSAAGVDDKIAQRMPVIHVGIWAENYEQAENRLHSLIEAVDYLVGDTDPENINGRQEYWPLDETQDVTTNGVQVVYSFNLAFDVLSRDRTITAYDAAAEPSGDRPTVGAGVDVDVVETVNIRTPEELDVPTYTEESDD